VVVTSSSSSNKDSGALFMDLLVGRDVALDFTVLLENKSWQTKEMSLCKEMLYV